MAKHTITIAIAALTMLAGVSATAQEVKIKKGKATMTEEQYTALKAKADAYETTKAELEALQGQGSNRPLVSFDDSASYAIGRDVYRQWNSQNIGINAAMAGQAMLDLTEGRDRITDEVAGGLLQRFQQEFEQRQMAGVQKNIEAGEKFMAEISNNKSVYTTESGLKYRRLKEGNGKRPTATDRVKVHYTGTLIDGTKFDSSVDRGEPITFPLDQVIPGWTEGVQLMDEGSKYILYVPYTLGYGEQPVGSIPPGSTLIFEVELLEINPQE